MAYSGVKQDFIFTTMKMYLSKQKIFSIVEKQLLVEDKIYFKIYWLTKSQFVRLLTTDVKDCI